MQRFEAGLVLEGGSIDVNGAGKLLTTEECLLSDVQARNPGLSAGKRLPLRKAGQVLACLLRCLALSDFLRQGDYAGEFAV